MVVRVRESEIETETGVLAHADLDRYSNAAVRACLGIGEGDTLFVKAEPAHRELVVAIAESAYRAGAACVDVHWCDPLMGAARVRHATRDEYVGALTPWRALRERASIGPGSATVLVVGDGEPQAFDGLPPERVAAEMEGPLKRMRWLVRAYQAGRGRWMVVAWPTAAWAALAYPELDPAEGRERLASDLLWFCRLGPDDPPGFEAWERHVDGLRRRAAALTELGLDRVELRGPGTRLVLTIPPAARWLGGRARNAFGQLVAENLPTEECYTSPDPEGTEGTFRSSRPLLLYGRRIEGITGEFRSGRLARLDADTEEQRDLLAAALDADRNGRRLGEIGLADVSSRIGQLERVYANTLIDENAAAHIGFGLGFGQTRDPAKPTRVNRSSVHVDVTIGTEALQVTGLAGRRRVPLLVDGTWCV